jgi:hypothetical protein
MINKALVKYESRLIGLRIIISYIENIGFKADLQSNDGAIDIREIVKREKYAFKNQVLYLPCILNPNSRLC